MSDAITIRFEDRQQDFLEFDIQDGKIVATRPFQGLIWNGLEVLNATVEPGDFIAVRTASGVRTILHPVAEVRPLTRIGPTDI